MVSSLPAVSVIIAAYNWSAALGLALRSVLRQSFQDFEVLIVGDACTDDSEAVVAAFEDKRFKWHNLEHNCGGQWRPNNYGLAAASGDWIAYLGQDDLWYPTHLRAAREQHADLVAAVAILYGPPGSGFRVVSGVFIDGQYAPSDFMPPSAIMHRRSLVERIGYWKNPETITLPVDCTFLLDAARSGARIVSTSELTAFKFNAAWRRDSYKSKDLREQTGLLNRIESGEDVRQAELLDVIRSVRAERFFAAELPPDGRAAGDHFRSNQRNKGVRQPYPAEELQRIVAPTRFLVADYPAPFEWHEIESNAFGTYRWSGPLPRATVDLPVPADQPLSIAVHILGVLKPDVLKELQLILNDRGVEFGVETTAEGTFLLRARAEPNAEGSVNNLRISFQLQRMMRPFDVLPDSRDKRALGLAVNWIEVAL